MAMEEGLDLALALIPLTTIGPSENVQFQLFEVTLEASGGAHNQSFAISPIIASESEQGQAPKNSLEGLVGIQAQMVDVTFEPSAGK